MNCPWCNAPTAETAFDAMVIALYMCDVHRTMLRILLNVSLDSQYSSITRDDLAKVILSMLRDEKRREA